MLQVVMAKVQIGNVLVLDNPSSFLNPFQFELTFECIEELKEGNFNLVLNVYYWNRLLYYWNMPCLW